MVINCEIEAIVRRRPKRVSVHVRDKEALARKALIEEATVNETDEGGTKLTEANQRPGVATGTVDTDERVSEVFSETYNFARNNLNLNREHAAYVADTAVREYIEQEEDE